MKSVFKILMLILAVPAWLSAQPGVRMSADFLPLEVGNRWVYDVFNEGGQKIGTIDFTVQDRRIVDGRSFYTVNNFPFVADGSDPAKLIRYDKEERQYVKIVDNREDPLFLADGSNVQVLQADASGLPQKFLLKMD